MRTPTGFRIDDPAFPLIQGLINYWGVTSGNGNALGTTLVCADLDNHASYVGDRLKILTGGAAGQVRQILIHAAGGIETVANPYTDAGGAAEQIVGGVAFVILSSLGGGGVAPGPPPPSVGLWMFGVCDPGMAGSTTAITCPNLAGMPDDIFNDDFYMEIIRNTDAPGVAPEHEIRLITDYVGATGAFVTDAFTANVEASDLVAIIHHSLVGPEENLISTLTRAMFDMVNSMLTLRKTDGTITLDGAEQVLYEVAYPLSVFEPLKVMVDLTNMTAAETIILRTYYRIIAVVPGGGALVLKDQIQIAGVQALPLKNIELEPNRDGLQVTCQRMAGGAIDIPWAAYYRV